VKLEWAAMKLLLPALLVLGACGVTRAQETAPVTSEVKVGAPAPDFAVKDHEGKLVKLADFKGKRVLLWFYPKADTGG